VESLPEDRYDYVVLFGTFNVAGDSPRDVWQSYIYSMLAAMYGLCLKGCGMTFLTTYYDPGFDRAELHYQDEKALMDYTVRNLSRHFAIDASGPLYEYSLRIYRPEYVHTLYTEAAFERYFKPPVR
jgi:hypothetical protein